MIDPNDLRPEPVHVYLSTACGHANLDRPELHERCRKVCKFCDAPCSCACHEQAGEPG